MCRFTLLRGVNVHFQIHSPLRSENERVYAHATPSERVHVHATPRSRRAQAH